MSGAELKAKLLSVVTLAEFGRKMEMTSQHVTQSLSVADVKTGFLEKICQRLNLKMSFFYPDDSVVNQYNAHAKNVTGTGNINEGGDNSGMLQQLMEQNSELIKIIKEKL